MFKKQIFAAIITLSFFSTTTAQDLKFLKLKKKYRTCILDKALEETSGLAYVDSTLISFNDSGNQPYLYKINPENGKIKTIKTNAKNYDWEAMATDGQNIYIGDFGNNRGNRKDLKIYRFPYSNDDHWTFDKIYEFQYAQQKDFTPRNVKHNFDAEAMIYHHQNLQIFSKEWASYDTKHYELKLNEADKQSLAPIEEYHLGYLATDATYRNGKLYIIGYTKKAEVFLTVFTESQPNRFFELKPEKYYLGMSFKLGQIEGITATENGLYISGERFKTRISDVKQPLYFLPYDKLK